MPRFYRNRVVVILCDTLLISLAFILSYYLRFSFDIPDPVFYFAQIKRTLPVVVALNLIIQAYTQPGDKVIIQQPVPVFLCHPE